MVISLLAVPRAQGGAPQAASPTRTHVEKLASPALEGRLTGSKGEQLASDYIAAELPRMGAKPLPGQRDYRIAFDFTAGTRDGGSSIAVGGTHVHGARRRPGALLLRQRRRHR